MGKQAQTRYEEYLYSPARMRSRVEIFFDYSLPILDEASRNHNVHHQVSYSQELPLSYQRHLEIAQQEYEWLHLDLRTPNNRKGTPLDNLARKAFSTGDIYAEYRLDDDDLLATSYFDHLDRYLDGAHAGYYVSFGLGIQAYFDGKAFREPRLEHRPKIAIGLARICKISDSGAIIGPPRVAHTRTDRRAPVIIDSRSVEYLHTLHMEQDSGVDKPDGDLGNRFRNYLNQPKPNDLLSAELFPGIEFGSLEDAEQIKMLIGAHAHFASLRGLARKALRYLRFPQN